MKKKIVPVLLGCLIVYPIYAMESGEGYVPLLPASDPTTFRVMRVDGNKRSLIQGTSVGSKAKNNVAEGKHEEDVPTVKKILSSEHERFQCLSRKYSHDKQLMTKEIKLLSLAAIADLLKIAEVYGEQNILKECKESLVQRIQCEAKILPQESTFNMLQKIDQQFSPSVIKSIRDECSLVGLLCENWQRAHCQNYHLIQGRNALAFDADKKSYVGVTLNDRNASVVVFPGQHTLIHKYQISAIALRADGKQLVTASDGVIYGWDTYNGEQLYHISRYIKKSITALALSRDKKQLAFVVDNKLHFWNILAGKKDTYSYHPSLSEVIQNCALHPDGTTFALIVALAPQEKNKEEQFYLRILSKKTGSLLHSVLLKRTQADALAFNNKGDCIAVNGGASISLYDVQTGGRVGSAPGGKPFAFESDDIVVVVGNFSYPLDISPLKNACEKLTLTQLYTALLCQDMYYHTETLKKLLKQNNIFLAHVNSLPLELKKALRLKYLKSAGVSMGEVSRGQEGILNRFLNWSLSTVQK